MFAVLKDLERILLIGIIAISIVGCSSTASLVDDQNVPQELSKEEMNKEFVTRYLTALGTQDYPPFVEGSHAENYVRTRQEFENIFDNAANDSVLLKDMEGVRAAFPDRKNTVTRILAQGDLVAATYRTQATHDGNFFGIPATGKKIDIEGAAIFKVSDGIVEEAFLMADEAALLRQLGVKLPARQDGKINISPKRGNIYTYDEKLAEHLESPADTPEYRHTRLLLSYKSQPENRPDDYQFEGRPYTKYLRSGIVNIVERGAELGVEGSHGKSLSGRRDMVSLVISDGDQSMMLFRLTAKNTGPLYGIPASGNDLDDWEMGFARFEGDTWVDGWWFKDELGYLLAIGNQQALDFLVD